MAHEHSRSASRRRILTTCGATFVVGLAGCTSGTNTADTTTQTATPTATETETTETTETTTTTEAVELPHAITPDFSAVDARAVYEASVVAPPNYHQKMQEATHEETDLVGLDTIAAAFEGNRVEQVKNVAAAAGKQYENVNPSSVAMVKAVHELDWFSFEDGARADVETLIENDNFPGTVLTYADESGELRRDFMVSQAQVTRPSRDYHGSFSESGFMDPQNDSQASPMDFKIMERFNWDLPEGATENIEGGWDNFLWGHRFDEANLVFTRAGGLLTTAKLKTSPEAARTIKDEVNTTYAWAEDKYDLEENYLKIDAQDGALVYSIISESMAQDSMPWG